MGPFQQRIILWVSVLSLLFALALPGVAAAGKPPHPGDKQVDVGRDGMVVTATAEASKVGADVLRKGGNAVDAAVAIQFALQVSEPMMSGIGGGGFMMVYEKKTDQVTIVDSRERAPAGATPDMFLDENGRIIPFAERSTHGNAIGVPGTLMGLETALQKWGTQPLAELIQPSITMAEKGVRVNGVLARAIQDHQEKLSRSEAKDVFLPGGEPLQAGDKLVQKDLAQTFRTIQTNGAHAFYQGEVGEAITATVQEYGGTMTAEDLADYRLTIDEPVRGRFQGYEIVTMPPPSSGGITVLQILNKLEQRDIGQYDVRSPEKYHLFAEASRLAYADRGAYIGDPEFVDVPQQGMLNPDYLSERATQIELERANPEVKPGNPWQFQQSSFAGEPSVQSDDRPIGETTHFTVADRWGNVVSYTTTIEQLFGTGIMAEGTGIMLNNELTDFDARPGGPNEVQPGKRPMSSMTPTLVFKDGKPVMALGSPGGATIIASVAQTILNVLVYDMDLKEAIEEPRIYTNAYPNIRWEVGIPAAVRADLEARGHRFDAAPQEIGNVNAIWIEPKTGRYYGAADSSREGTAIGIGGK
ncbi:gamma-glutamyltransferase [Desmospora activa]|uniref:Glutathione hydrolase proenzyme n=1 Tax=Desmospora activa DSM 45169 TaxID=1121389 RepID=A0A2T4Z1X2_9BACL|nr:gamma-glutamyltransferase [Desmospora activa]PTM54786.1 gamma-glutamyltransferase 1 [Desmospora activa DSM 45169]